MKKIVFTLAALMSMTFAFAEGESSAKANEVANVENAKYEMNVNVNSLSQDLGLDADTEEAVDYIFAMFHRDMHKVAMTSDNSLRNALYKKAINYNLANMRSVLSDSQYREYVKLLNTTINNRGLNK